MKAKLYESASQNSYIDAARSFHVSKISLVIVLVLKFSHSDFIALGNTDASIREVILNGKNCGCSIGAAF